MTSEKVSGTFYDLQPTALHPVSNTIVPLGLPSAQVLVSSSGKWHELLFHFKHWPTVLHTASHRTNQQALWATWIGSDSTLSPVPKQNFWTRKGKFQKGISVALLGLCHLPESIFSWWNFFPCKMHLICKEHSDFVHYYFSMCIPPAPRSPKDRESPTESAFF